MRVNGAEIIVRLLERYGVEVVAGIPGGANLPLYSALHRSRIRHVLARHEQGAGFIAHGMARSTGRPAVCLATSGPGATNLITALADAKLDSVPLIAITGQVSSGMIGTDAFQEVDTYGMTMHITKHNFLVKSAKELLSVIPEAFVLAASGRPGPVLIDVPKDVQLEEVDVNNWPDLKRPEASSPDALLIERAAHMIAESERPVFYAGGGVVSSGCHGELMALSRKNSIPVALTLMGLGAFPPQDPRYLGMLGMHGAPFTNIILDEADLILAFGVRFDDRAVGNAREFCREASIIHVDVDEAEINKIRRADLSIVGDAGNVIRAMLPLIPSNKRTDWMCRVGQLKQLHALSAQGTDDCLRPCGVLRALALTLPEETIVTTDVGQHQMWVAQAYPFTAPRRLLTSGGLGTMGFGLPAAIGAALGNPGRTVLCVSGDGSFQMNIQELATLAELDLPVKIVIMNNGHLGLVRQQQELFYEKRYIASRFSLRLDFAALARQFGIRGFRVSEPGDLSGLPEALSGPAACVIDIPIHSEENVYPIVPPGKANREMIGTELH
ncbi:MAG: biosynthetic-type acetolactate synthase large subunit [Syntrophales bacterium LBB04]|nr:biosynthetic-type acetolactate synthase large subunit [Syntrophales bacterium LBB04]